MNNIFMMIVLKNGCLSSLSEAFHIRGLLIVSLLKFTDLRLSVCRQINFQPKTLLCFLSLLGCVATTAGLEPATLLTKLIQLCGSDQLSYMVVIMPVYGRIVSYLQWVT